MKKFCLTLTALLSIASTATFAKSQTTIDIVNNTTNAEVTITAALAPPFIANVTAVLTSEGRGPVNLYDEPGSAIKLEPGKNEVRIASDSADSMISNLNVAFSNACGWRNKTFYFNKTDKNRDHLITIGGKNGDKLTYDGVLKGYDEGMDKCN